MSTSSPLSSPSGGAKLIHAIRSGHGVDDDPESAQHPAVLELRGKLERALNRLTNDLYNKKTHFLLEVIQNADDNTYGANIVPTLRLRIDDRLVVFECNELGFNADNVKAICDIGGSTKLREKNSRGFIGEKGIGFKSVFTVADKVYITSGPYSFHFDKTMPLGMITPILSSTYPPVRGWTTFHLHLAPSENGNDLSAQLRDVRPTLLLFLRQLRALSITTPGFRTRSIEVRRTDDDDRDMVTLERIQSGVRDVERYVLVRHLAQTPTEEPGREDIKESEIVLAFPVTETQEPVTKKQEVHAFLPLRCYGFKFIIQADFITSASREDVLADKPWNEALRGSIVDAFLLAVDRFEDDPVIRNVWFRYLPESISDSFFSYVEHKLLEELRWKQILRSVDGTYHCASQFFFLPLTFHDDSGAPLIPEAYLPRGHRYLSPDYDIHPDGQDRQVLRRLGVREMTSDDFFACLALMDKANMFGAQSNAWHDAVATCLLNLPRPTYGTIRPEVLPLRILPLHNGSWVPAALASTVAFPPGVNIPDDLNLQSIAPGISPFSSRYQLFIRLGVMPPNPVSIARRILMVSGPRSVAARVSHARFFFDNRREFGMPPAMRLRLVDQRGEAAQSDELYLDLPEADGILSLRDALSPTARFLHPDYLSAYPESTETDDDEGNGEDDVIEDTRSGWLNWLRDHVGLNVVPRVLDGVITPEFLSRAPALEGRELLVSLRAWWPRLRPQLTDVGARALGTISIAGRRLDTLYLRRGALARVDVALELPSIPVDDPENRAWDFLEQLGVATRMNASFFVNKLVHMQAMGEKDYKTVEDIYKQLDARFDEDEALIKDAFKQYPIILLSVKDGTERDWLHKMNVCWHGPPSLKSKAVISRSYPHLSNFFFTKLGIAQAPPYALVDELRLISDRYRSRPVPQDVWEHVANILADISDVIEEMPGIPRSFQVLADMPAFPVRGASEGIVLRHIDGFYIPDKASKYADVFRDRVPLLDFPKSVPMSRIRPLLECDVLKDKLRYVDLHVTKRSVPQGKRVLDSKATELYSSKVEYIARLLFHNSNKSDFSPEETKVLAKLHKITVISVQAITTTLSLGTCVETTSEDVAFEETDDKFTVFVSRTSSQGKSINPPICGALSRLIEVDMMTLFTCITQPVEVVSYFFEIKGIAEIPVDDGHDRSWLQAITQPNVPIIPTPVVPEKSLSPVPPSSPPPRSPIAHSVQEVEHFPPLGAKPTGTSRRALSPSPSTSAFNQSSSHGRQRQRSWAHGSVGVSEHSQSMQTSFNSGPVGPTNALRDTNRLAVQAEAFVNGNQVPEGPLAVPLWPPFGNFNAPVSTDETDMVGIMGEHFVYKQLIRLLDDFGPDNWTSELRNGVAGFTPFRGQAYADFTYLDRQGQLTRAWFGAEKATAWHGRWPRYHIEVKSTRGEENEPFHMSGIQMATAFAFAERTHLGENMYVIVRVWGIGRSEPSFQVYLDPHRALFSGYLLYAGDVHLQRNTSQV